MNRKTYYIIRRSLLAPFQTCCCRKLVLGNSDRVRRIWTPAILLCLVLFLLTSSGCQKKPVQSLHEVAAEGNIDKIKAIISGGADVNAKDKGGNAPLHYAVMLAKRDVIEMLISNGADVNVKDADGRTPLHNVATYGDVNIEQLLVDKGADVNAKDSNGRTPLSLANEMNNMEIAGLLLLQGAKE